MPDQRGVNAASRAVESARSALGMALYRAGYDPHAPDTFPAEADAPPPLAAAMRAWDAANERLEAAYARHSGARY